jgi:hypothetical protein
MARRNGRSSPARVKAAERQQRALEMRRDGRTCADIAKHLGYASEAGARKAIHAALDGVRSESGETVERMRRLEQIRLDELTMILEIRIDDAGEDFSLRDVDALLRIMDRRARLLGLDAPRGSGRSGWASVAPPETAQEVRELLIRQIMEMKSRKAAEAAAACEPSSSPSG